MHLVADKDAKKRGPTKTDSEKGNKKVVSKAIQKDRAKTCISCCFVVVHGVCLQGAVYHYRRRELHVASQRTNQITIGWFELPAAFVGMIIGAGSRGCWLGPGQVTVTSIMCASIKCYNCCLVSKCTLSRIQIQHHACDTNTYHRATRPQRCHALCVMLSSLWCRGLTLLSARRLYRKEHLPG